MAVKKKDQEEPVAEPQRQTSAVVMWIQDQWEGWLKSVGGLLLAVIGWALYKFDLVGEGLAGAAVVLAVILGAFGSTALPAWPFLRSQAQKSLLIVVVLVSALATGYPTMRAAMPPKAAGEVRLTAAKPSASMHLPGDGPWEMAVGGTFKNAGGEAEVSYTIKVNGNGSEEVSDSIKRSLVRMRTSRRGGTSTTIQERTENVHRLEKVRGNELTVSTDSVDEQLADGLLVDVRPAGPQPLLFILLGALAALGALVLDARIVDPKGKGKGYLAVAAGVCLVFALRFPDVATPHSLVRPAVDALVFALLVGALPGWLLGMMARGLFGPKIKKAPARASRA